MVSAGPLQQEKQEKREKQEQQGQQGQRGSASVLTLLLVILSVVLIQVCVLIGARAVQQAKVQAVADLVALHGATQLRWSTPVGVAPGQGAQEEACAAAAALAQLNAVELTQCVVRGSGVFSLSVEVAGTAATGTSTTTARARAGPQY